MFPHTYRYVDINCINSQTLIISEISLVKNTIVFFNSALFNLDINEGRVLFLHIMSSIYFVF